MASKNRQGLSLTKTVYAEIAKRAAADGVTPGGWLERDLRARFNLPPVACLVHPTSAALDEYAAKKVAQLDGLAAAVGAANKASFARTAADPETRPIAVEQGRRVPPPGSRKAPVSPPSLPKPARPVKPIVGALARQPHAERKPQPVNWGNSPLPPPSSECRPAPRPAAAVVQPREVVPTSPPQSDAERALRKAGRDAATVMF